VKAYAGIGSQETPADVCHAFAFTAARLARRGWTLRTGGAKGADAAFLEGVKSARGTRGLYLPCRGYNGHTQGIYPPPPAAFKLAAAHHPAWKNCGCFARALHARNGQIVLGPDVDQPSPVGFVLCWTPGGSGSGGTGQAIRVARAYDVPVHDVGDPVVWKRLTDWLAVPGRSVPWSE
jgi:hypothetical protein